MESKVTHTFLTGSIVFFKDMPNYNPHDIDRVCILDYPIFGDHVVEMRKDGVDTFFVYNGGKDYLIDQCIKANVPMSICKFLNSDFANYLDMNIDDLKKLKNLSEKMDNKHLYLKMIYDFYIDNNGFYLTDKQRELAYQEYLSKR